MCRRACTRVVDRNGARDCGGCSVVNRERTHRRRRGQWGLDKYVRCGSPVCRSSSPSDAQISSIGSRGVVDMAWILGAPSLSVSIAKVPVPLCNASTAGFGLVGELNGERSHSGNWRRCESRGCGIAWCCLYRPTTEDVLWAFNARRSHLSGKIQADPAKVQKRESEISVNSCA